MPFLLCHGNLLTASEAEDEFSQHQTALYCDLCVGISHFQTGGPDQFPLPEQAVLDSLMLK